MNDDAAPPATPSAPPQKRRRGVNAKEQFRDELAEIARDLFEREGSAAVSIRAVARAAGISPMAVYRYFPNKMTLLSKLWDRIFMELAQALEAGLTPGLSIQEQLHAALDIYVDYWLSRPDHFRMIYVEPALDPQAQAELDFWSESQGLTRLRTLVLRLMTALRPLDAPIDRDAAAVVEQLTIYLSGLIHTLMGRVENTWLNHERAREGARRVVVQILQWQEPDSLAIAQPART